MKLRATISTPINSSVPCNSGTATVNTSGVLIDILQNGASKGSALLNVFAIAPTTILDNHGNSVTFSASTTDNIITFDIGLLNVFDYVDLEFNITGLYNTYNNTFRIYGYDLGNDISNGITANYDFELVLLTNNQPYASIIAYRQPFSNKIHYYKSNSSVYTTFELYDTSMNLISTNANGTFIEGDIQIASTITNASGTCIQNSFITLNEVTWIPTFQFNNNCTVNCNTSCVLVGSTNNVDITVDYTNVDTVYVNDVEVYPFTDVSYESTIVASDGTLVQHEVIMDYIYYGYYGATLVKVKSFPNYIVPSIGSFTIQVCFNILGYEAGMITSGSLNTDSYYYINKIAPGGNFAAISADPGTCPATLGSVFQYKSGTPMFGSNGVIEALVTGNPTADKYYKVKEIHANADFGNICTDPDIYNRDTVFYSDGTAPLSWGTSASPLYAPDYVGTILIETLPVFTCCKSIQIDGCQNVEINRLSCGKFEITNNGLLDTTVETYIYTDGSWILLDTDTIESLDSTEIDLINDGIYRFDIEYDGVTTSQLYFVSCTIEECYTKYLDSLICCNTESNCSPCEDDDCSQKEYYNFNAFSMLIDNYVGLVTSVTGVTNVFTPSTIIDNALLNNLHTISDIMNRAFAYCLDCETPCNNC